MKNKPDIPKKWTSAIEAQLDFMDRAVMKKQNALIDCIVHDREWLQDQLVAIHRCIYKIRCDDTADKKNVEVRTPRRCATCLFCGSCAIDLPLEVSGCKYYWEAGSVADQWDTSVIAKINKILKEHPGKIKRLEPNIIKGMEAVDETRVGSHGQILDKEVAVTMVRCECGAVHRVPVGCACGKPVGERTKE